MASAYLRKLRLFNRDVRLYLIAIALIGLTISGGIRQMLLNLYLVRLGYGPQFIGLVNAASSQGFAVLSLPADALAPRWGTRRIMIAGSVLMVVHCGLFPFAEAVPGAWQRGWLITTYVVAWAGVAICFVNGLPFLMATTGPEERHHAFATQLALEPLFGFVGSLIAGFLPGVVALMLGASLSDPATYRVPLFISALLLAPAVLALWRTSEVNSRGGGKPRGGGRSCPLRPYPDHGVGRGAQACGPDDGVNLYQPLSGYGPTRFDLADRCDRGSWTTGRRACGARCAPARGALGKTRGHLSWVTGARCLYAADDACAALDSSRTWVHGRVCAVGRYHCADSRLQ
jgi:hypothetical protein